MILTFTFLVNNDHPQDAWVLSGIAARQACVLQLNHDREEVVPAASAEHKTLRLTVWSIVMAQDCGIALFLKFPPSCLINDISEDSYDVAYNGIDIASPFEDYMDLRPLPALAPEAQQNDLSVLRCVWQMNTFMQKNSLVPRALQRPMCKSVEHEKRLIDELRELWQSYPSPFNSSDPNRIFATSDFRLSRQLIGLASVFHHPMMLIHGDTNPGAGVPVDVYGVLEAGHELLIGFFAMNELFGSDNFWSIQHRSFEVALAMAKALASISSMATLPDGRYNNILTPASLTMANAKEDIRRMLDIVRLGSGYFEFATKDRSKMDMLRMIYEKITI